MKTVLPYSNDARRVFRGTILYKLLFVYYATTTSTSLVNYFRLVELNVNSFSFGFSALYILFNRCHAALLML